MFREFKTDDSLRDIAATDSIIAYELAPVRPLKRNLPCSPEEASEEAPSYVYVNLQPMVKNQYASTYSNYTNNKEIGLPTFVKLPSKCSVEMLYSSIRREIVKWTKADLNEIEKALMDQWMGQHNLSSPSTDDSTPAPMTDKLEATNAPIPSTPLSASAEIETQNASKARPEPPKSYLFELGRCDLSIPLVDSQKIEVVFTEQLKEQLFHNGQSYFDDWMELENQRRSENQAQAKTSQRIDIAECLKEFEKTEKLGEDNSWYVPKLIILVALIITAGTAQPANRINRLPRRLMCGPCLNWL